MYWKAESENKKRATILSIHCECKEESDKFLKFKISTRGMRMMKGKRLKNWIIPNH